MSNTNLGFVEPTPLDPATVNVWGATINENFTLLDSAIVGVEALNIAGSSDVNLTANAGAADTSRFARFVFSGLLTGNVTIYFPTSRTILFSVMNNTTGAFTLRVAVGTSPTPVGRTVTIPQAGNAYLVSDGTNIDPAVDYVGLGAIVVACVPGDARNASMSVATAATTGTITADQIVVGTALGGTFYAVSSYSQAINLATTGAGGMDTGLAPVNGFVSIYAIYNPLTATASVLCQNASGGSPTIYSGAHMPAGYTANALIGIWPTDASRNFAVAVQKGRTLSYSGSIAVLTGGFSSNYTNLSLTAAVPLSAVSANGWGSIISSGGTGGSTLFIASSGTGTASGVGEVRFSATVQPAITPYLAAPFYGMLLSTAQQISYRLASVAGVTASIGINGYTF